MITYENLSKKPGIFKGFTGVTIAEFDELLEQATSIWVEQEQRRLDRPDRQRAMGGGCKPKFRLEGQLMVTLVWLRLYLTTEALGFLFGIDKATVSRYTRSILPVLRQVGESTLGWPEPPKRGEGKSIAQARQEHPDLFAFVDATEQPIRRSSNSEIQKDHYSGKKKRHTRKVQIVTNEHGEIWAVSTSVPGSDPLSRNSDTLKGGEDDLTGHLRMILASNIETVKRETAGPPDGYGSHLVRAHLLLG